MPCGSACPRRGRLEKARSDQQKAGNYANARVCGHKKRPERTLVFFKWWWSGNRHPTTIESTQSKRCWPERTPAGSSRKRQPVALPLWTGNRFSCWIGRRFWLPNRHMHRSSSIPERAIELCRSKPCGSAQFVPDTTSTTVLVQVSALDQCTEVLLECVAAGTGQLDGLTNGDTPVLASEFDDLQRKFR